MKIHVKVLNGADISPTVSENTTVAELKDLICRELDIPANKQRLVFKGKPLQDDSKLKSYSIIPESKIMLTIKNDSKVVTASAHTTKTTTSSSPEDTCPSQSTFQQQLMFVLMKHFNPSDAYKVYEQYSKNWNRAMSELTLDNIEKTAILNLSKAS